MAHSNRLRVHWSIVIVEIVLFVAAIVSAYLSQVGQWPGFIVVSVVMAVLFATVKAIEAIPAGRELLVREDMASKIAVAAEKYGVREYFNMQSARDQTTRNESTQREINRARNLWLCANSGASFLDPGVYRHWQFIKRRLDEGAEFRVALLDPFSGEKAFRNLINVNGEALDSKINLANLIRLHNTYPSLEIRFVQHGMHATVFATEHCLFFDPYQVGVVAEQIENRSFSLHIEPSSPTEGVGLYRLFKGHFDTLWRTSMSFSDWMTHVQPQLPPGLPDLRPRQR
jgi:hypothetical protein